MKPANELGAFEAARAIESGALTSESLVRACLERIARRNDDVLAFTAYDPQVALAAARRADDSPGTPLRGIPFAAKDVIDTAGYVTAYGSVIYNGHRPAVDAACVTVAREQGAVLLGKVATSEFATQTPSATRNPWNLAHTPGGSSSGSAAAVADFMVPIAFGTQTTGSIMRPASYCGVVGYKPTFGLINPAGLKALSPTQDTIGILARHVEDAALFAFGRECASTVLAADELRPRLGVCQSRQWDHARPETVAAIELVARKAEKHGATVRRITLPGALEELIETQARIFFYEARQSLAYERIHCADRLSRRLQERLAGGAGISVDDYLSMRREVARGRDHVRGLFTDIDALLYPAADGEAEAGIANSGSPRFGALWTLLHLPCLCVPVTRGPAGLPVGVQAVGAHADDRRLLRIAGFLGRIGGA